MKVWYVLLDQSHPSDADPTHRDSPAEQALQSAYRQTILDGTHIYHPSTTLDQTKLRIHEWRNDLDRLRDESRRHAARQDAISQKQTELLKRLIKGQEELAHRARADGKTLTDYTSEEILAELARREGITPAELRRLINEALRSDDLSIRAQALMLEQQFAQAAALFRQAGDAKAQRLHALRQRSDALAEEVALDYNREGVACIYQSKFADAIVALENALKQVTHASHAVLWASLQSNLAVALTELGIRAEPQEGNRLLARAEKTCRNALGLIAQSIFPSEWASIQDAFGSVLQELSTRGCGESVTALLQESVAAFRAAQEVHTRLSAPREWAGHQHNFACALVQFGKYTKGQAGFDLLGQAITAYRSALDVRSRKVLPEKWAMTQCQIGVALSNQARRSQGKTALDLLGEAVCAYRAALEVTTRKSDPQGWALIQHNLGNVLIEQGCLSDGQIAFDFLEEALVAFQAALEVRTREGLPQKWAMTQCGIATALVQQGILCVGRIGTKLLAEAISISRSALAVYTRKSLPQDWAGIHNNLSLAFTYLGDRATSATTKRKYYRQAEATLQSALEVYCKAADSPTHDLAQRNLTHVRKLLKQLE